MLNRRLKYGALGILSSLIMLAAMAMGGVGTAFADGPAGSFPVNGASNVTAALNTAFAFSSDALGSHSISSITLNGQDQDIYIDMPVKIVDARGTGGGWTVSLYAAAFANSGHSLSTPSITGITNLGVGTDSSHLNGTSDSNAVGSYTGVMPADADSEEPLLTADTGSSFGMGTYTLDVKMHQVILAKDYAESSYTSTFNLDIAQH